MHRPLTMSGVQDSKVKRLLEFLEEPKQLSDKDLAAAVGAQF